MPSKMFEEVLRDAISSKVKDIEKQKVGVDYDIVTTSTRGNDVATATIRLSKPIPEKDINVSDVLQGIGDSIRAEQLGIFDSILVQSGIKKSKVGKKKTSGSVEVITGIDGEVGEDSYKDGIRGAGGRFISNTNLRSMLELAAKKYLIESMRKPSAPLKHRTGRFANSLKITDVVKDKETQVRTSRPASKKNKPRVSILYTYMTYPYATFDPKVSNRPEMYMRPSYGARNPQVHIGNAIAKAARDILYSGYQVKVNQRG